MREIATRSLAEAGRSRAGTPASLRLLHLTDFHLLAESHQRMMGVDTERSLASVLEAALSAGPPPDLALFTGDLVQDPEASAYRRLRAQLRELPCPGYCVPGNHDDPKLLKEILPGDNLHVQPHIGLGNWQVLCLDSTVPRQAHGYLAETQLQLLESWLDREPARYTLIALHHHPIPCGCRWMDTMVLQNADRFFAIVAQRPQVRGVVFGHIHQALDVVYRGIRLLGTPATCFQFKPNSAEFALDGIPPGYRRIELHPDGTLSTTLERLGTVPGGLDMGARGY
ncbi:3',5'-cyclic-AMP phosphodiesterase [Candidatus Methylocalor cossyra]|uniref:3',5'-cyclic adenosine monophosphate phosphodiesterase CpdA n=1 Tax=Candidatus Methylocalor cossyra TaxID=3108543 RepID=A0ABM9NF30_9GAMM